MSPVPAETKAWAVSSVSQIKGELRDFARRLQAPALAERAGYGRVFGTGVSTPAGQSWARQLNRNLNGATLQIDDVRFVSMQGVVLRALVLYHFEPKSNEPKSNSRARQDAAPRRETVNFEVGAARRDPDEVLNLTNAEATRAYRARWAWEIVPPPAPPPALETDLLAAPNAPFWTNVAFYLRPKLDVAPDASLDKRSLHKLWQLGVSAQWFAQEHGGRYALAPNFIGALAPYAQNVGIFMLPDSREFYSFNSQLLDARAQAIAAPGATVLFYEGSGQKPTFRYDGKAAIGFADGHVALVSPDEAKGLIWKP